MKFTITIEADNSAFEGDELGPETARILRDLAIKFEMTPRSRIEKGELMHLIRDANGNTVGMVTNEDN